MEVAENFHFKQISYSIVYYRIKAIEVLFIGIFCSVFLFNNFFTKHEGYRNIKSPSKIYDLVKIGATESINNFSSGIWNWVYFSVELPLVIDDPVYKLSSGIKTCISLFISMHGTYRKTWTLSKSSDRYFGRNKITSKTFSWINFIIPILSCDGSRNFTLI